jgi:hypothetical protein
MTLPKHIRQNGFEQILKLAMGLTGASMGMPGMTPNETQKMPEIQALKPAGKMSPGVAGVPNFAKTQQTNFMNATAPKIPSMTPDHFAPKIADYPVGMLVGDIVSEIGDQLYLRHTLNKKMKGEQPTVQKPNPLRKTEEDTTPPVEKPESVGHHLGRYGKGFGAVVGLGVGQTALIPVMKALDNNPMGRTEGTGLPAAITAGRKLWRKHHPETEPKQASAGAGAGAMSDADNADRIPYGPYQAQAPVRAAGGGDNVPGSGAMQNRVSDQFTTVMRGLDTWQSNEPTLATGGTMQQGSAYNDPSQIKSAGRIHPMPGDNRAVDHGVRSQNSTYNMTETRGGIGDVPYQGTPRMHDALAGGRADGHDTVTKAFDSLKTPIDTSVMENSNNIDSAGSPQV